MKRLISIIVQVILSMTLAGCVVVEEHVHHRRGPHAVIVTRPRPLPIPPGPPHHHRGWHGH
ncbi:MAG: hypothetical protein JSW66_19095 [Phycisphaerales bacterium]|nr:MAG: hypothetical protein JSW66_19095 [Phycisphaerales bacterium]